MCTSKLLVGVFVVQWLSCQPSAHFSVYWLTLSRTVVPRSHQFFFWSTSAQIQLAGCSFCSCYSHLSKRFSPFVSKRSFNSYIALMRRENSVQYKPISQKSTLTLLWRRRPWWLFWSRSFQVKPCVICLSRSKWVTSCQRNPLCCGEF